ncbi:hypothetical protein NTD86_24080 [Pseudomonas sp. 7P_10.2_Bac1]|uniref:PA3371 family protein n=1 Tax=Pseudomonas sp. 7P_10.2_Bac1 TaxID=2971614 RepID=UPI0021C6B0D1|nr:PA3371 family protein [Pseudomonas sp. 7P_10.2_Bac1]MCU1730049.1 hypothetical protein [Pseudomonas sp. 7P_10.2_Bac1]
MSKIAFGLMVLTLLSLALGVFTQDAFGDAPLIASAVFFIGWLLARVLGRRFKFDPQLR